MLLSLWSLYLIFAGFPDVPEILMGQEVLRISSGRYKNYKVR